MTCIYFIVVCWSLHIPNGRVRHQNGDAVGSRYPVGTVAQFSCYRAYTRDGPFQATCQASGEWDQQKPRCNYGSSVVTKF